MTKLAKFLVFVTFFFAIGLFAWGLSAYTARADTLAKDVGATALAQDEIKTLTAKIADATAAYNRRRREVLAAENTRVERQLAYAARLREGRSGKLRQQVPGADGVFTDLKTVGPDALGSDGKPLQGLEVLKNRFAEETRAIETLIDGTEAVPEQDWQTYASTATAEEIAARQPRLGIDSLRRLAGLLSSRIRLEEIALDRTRAIQGGLADEAAYLNDRRINVTAELQLLQTRQRQLLRRLDSFAR